VDEARLPDRGADDVSVPLSLRRQDADAEAICDLDCDGTTITYTLQMSSDAGNPTATITEPPPNTD